MTAEDFAAWMEHRGYNNLQAAAALGVGRNSITRYLRIGADKTVALACSADAMNLKPWPLG
jgi:hypothetical protein